MKVLILGKMKQEGDFLNAECCIRRDGHIPINPVRVLHALPEDLTMADFIAVLIELVRISDAICLLDNFISDLASSVAWTNAKKNEKEIYKIEGDE